MKTEEYQAALVLEGCFDFANEKSALREILESRGHLLIQSPKGHPEIAGSGVEYSFGFCKRNFRRSINDGLAKNLETNVQTCISAEHLPIDSKFRFERKTRDYLNGYRELYKDPTLNAQEIRFIDIENMMKIRKTHRNILDIEYSFLTSEASLNCDEEDNVV